MNSKRIVSILFPVVLAFVFLVNGCAPFRTPQIKDINHFSFTRNQGTNFDFDFGVELYNPNSYRLTLVDLGVEVFINDKKVGTAQVPFKQFLKKRSSGNISFKVNADLRDLLGNVWDMLSAAFTKGKKTKFMLKGKIKARVFPITKSFPFEFAKDLGFEF